MAFAYNLAKSQPTFTIFGKTYENPFFPEKFDGNSSPEGESIFEAAKRLTREKLTEWFSVKTPA
mgnify:CR=1 FL=1